MPNSQHLDIPIGQHQLFLDDHGIAKIENLHRTMHQPKKKGAVIQPEGPWEQAIQTRSTPAWDEHQQTYKLWLIPGMRPAKPGEEFHGRAYAESKDGIHWTKPALGLREYGGSKENNLLGPLAPENALCDPDDPDPGRRYKGFMGDDREPIVSLDGIHWTKLDVPKIPSGDESNLSYDRLTRTFIATTKTGGPFGRSHAIWTSKDFEEWTNTGCVFSADELDQELGRLNIEQCFSNPSRRHPAFNIPETYNVDVYNLGIFRYEGLYIGLPSMFHQTGKVSKDWPGFDTMDLPDDIRTNVHLYGDWTGFHHVQLMSSRNLLDWTRLGERQPFLDLSLVDGNAYDTQVIMPPSDVIVNGDELRLYYTGIRNYAYVTSTAQDSGGAVCLATLRRDGFVSLDVKEQPGILCTKPFILPGTKLYVNLNSLKGSLTIQVLDTAGNILAVSKTLEGDMIAEEVSWKQGDIGNSKGKPISLQFTLTSGSLYSYWIDN
jgi:hypothetical protein